MFEARNVRRLGHLGWALIGIDLADMAQRLIAGPLLTHLGATEPFFSLGLGLGLSIVGLFVIVIARVMDLGRELKEFESLAI